MATTLQMSNPTTTKRTIRALVVDDHPIVAEALATAIAAMRVFEHIDSANSLSEACKRLEQNPACNLALLDLHLSDVEGRGTLLGLRERFPDIPVLVFSGDDSL